MHSFMDTQGTCSIFILFFFKEKEIRLIFTYFSLHDDALIKIKENREMSTGRTRTKDPEINLP